MPATVSIKGEGFDIIFIEWANSSTTRADLRGEEGKAGEEEGHRGEDAADQGEASSQGRAEVLPRSSCNPTGYQECSLLEDSRTH